MQSRGSSPFHIIKVDRRSLLGAGAATLMLAGKAWAQQVPIPTTAAQVPGPPSGTAMTTAYVESVARMAYVWGWPLVNNANRHKVFSEAPEPGLLGGVLPIAHNAVAMLTNYVSPEQRFVTCTNQDVVYGFGFCTTWTRSPSSSRFRISAIASGSLHSTTRAPTSSRRSANNMAPSLVSI
jgi:hypothetical protein